MNAPRDVSHDEVVVAMLKANPDFANEYLAAALEESRATWRASCVISPHCGTLPRRKA